jgi:diguanylate cyclase (GGDEF)-like protein/PAS domain S-box-containing protein
MNTADIVWWVAITIGVPAVSGSRSTVAVPNVVKDGAMAFSKFRHFEMQRSSAASANGNGAEKYSLGRSLSRAVFRSIARLLFFSWSTASYPIRIGFGKRWWQNFAALLLPGDADASEIPTPWRGASAARGAALAPTSLQVDSSRPRPRALGLRARARLLTRLVSGLSAVLLLVLAYFAAGKVGLSLAMLNPSATAVWAPTGIALAALLVFGFRVWPAILVAAFLVNVTTAGPVETALAIAIGNTLEAVVGAYLVVRFARGRDAFQRVQDMVKFAFLAGTLATTLSATIGVTTLALHGLASWSDYNTLWLTWWFGDAAGAIIVTPVLVLWANSAVQWKSTPALEVGSIGASLLLMVLLIFGGLTVFSIEHYPVQYLLLPAMVWAAFRLSPRETATAILIISAIAVAGTVNHFGPFAIYPPNEGLLMVQSFVSFIGITFLSLSVVVAQRERAEEVQRWLASIVESTSDAVVGKSLDGVILTWNQAAERVYGYTAAEAIDQPVSMLAPPDKQDEVRELLERGRRGERIRQYETERLRKDGARISVALTISPIKDASGAILGLSTIARDISAQKQAQEALLQAHAELEQRVEERTAQLSNMVKALNAEIVERKHAEQHSQYLAQHDVLTGLPNRALFQVEVARIIAEAKAGQRRVAILLLDLDDFKRINESFGHQIGDRLLQETARRLQRCIQEGDSLSRLGGDEFVVCLANPGDDHNIMVVAGKILEVLREPYRVSRHELRLSASIGISLYPTDGEDAGRLLRAADSAVYYAKVKGRNTYQFFTSRLNSAARHRLMIANHLHGALERGEFSLHYQPQVDLQSGRIFAAEALVRWQQPKDGLVLPGEFIKIAEQTGVIVPLGEWVLREACEQLANLHESGHPDLSMAVNVSPQQFRHSGFPELVWDVLQQTRLQPSALELELTEGIMTVDSPENLAVLEQLAKMGIQLAVDDFGTGYSSLSYLQRFPMHSLKIDQSFVNGVGEQSHNTAFVRSIIAMAHTLHMKTMAEGVETAAQVTFLRAHGCEAGQGFYFGQALAAEPFAELLRAQQAH